MAVYTSERFGVGRGGRVGRRQPPAKRLQGQKLCPGFESLPLRHFFSLLEALLSTVLAGRVLAGSLSLRLDPSAPRVRASAVRAPPRATRVHSVTPSAAAHHDAML